MNRGAAKRPVFESREDMRMFLACLARVVRAGLLEVHAFCMLLNHFHLLVRSPTGELSKAMQLLTNRYVRYFNRRRRRDGALFRGRFCSSVVDSLVYRRTVVRYIDDNPVKAGSVADAAKYPWCSRACYARTDGPRWLQRDWVERQVAEIAGADDYAPGAYAIAFPSGVAPCVAEWIERRLRFDDIDGDAFDDLVAAAGPEVREKMARRLERADGVSPTAAVLAPGVVRSVLRRLQDSCAAWRTTRGTRRRLALPYATAGLLVDLCGLSHDEAAAWMGVPRSTAQNRLRVHRAQLAVDPGYRDRCSELAEAAFEEFRQLLQPAPTDVACPDSP